MRNDQKMSDEERQALIRKMDEDLQDFIEDRKAAHKENTKTDEPYNKTVEDLVKVSEEPGGIIINQDF